MDNSILADFGRPFIQTGRVPESSATLPSDSRRKENRLPVNTRGLPFLATLTGKDSAHTCFQYLLKNVSPGGVGFSLPRHVANREYMQQGLQIHFHIPFKLSDRFYDRGIVRWVSWSEEEQGQVCGAELQTKTPLHYPLYISYDTGEIVFRSQDDQPVNMEVLLKNLLKDALLLKKGMLIYYKHLSPFFSKIGSISPRHYPMLKTVFLGQVEAHLERNITELDFLLQRVHQADFSIGRLDSILDLDRFREVLEPEIDTDLFRHSFQSETVVPYLNSIKVLEHRLYTIYNTVSLTMANRY